MEHVSENNLAKQFNLGSLLWFVTPNVIMMIALSLYVIVDGMFISRLVGTDALSAANMVFPIFCFEMALGIMIGTGGNAIIAFKLGQGKKAEARQNLTMLIVVELLVGLGCSIIGLVFLDELLAFIGASERQYAFCYEYAKVLLLFSPMFCLQVAYQSFFVAAGKPILGLISTLLAGVLNIVLDYLFMAVFNLGMTGAALATGLGYCMVATIGTIFFTFNRKQDLFLTKFAFDGEVLYKSCTNGSSEMVTNLASAVTTFLFNIFFLKFYGEDGVAAITIMLYLQFVFGSFFFGYANGVAPVISFKYGHEDAKQLKQIFRSSLIIIMLSAIVINISLQLGVNFILASFTEPNSSVYALAQSGFTLFSLSFLLMGFGVFASALFTAFSDGKTSALISFGRTFIFVVGSILLLPMLLGENGLWLAVPFAELCGAVLSLFFIVRKRKVYAYV